MLSSVTSSISVTEVKERSFTFMEQGKTYYVGGSGPGNYTIIQDAVDDSKSGDTIFIYNDSSPYIENVYVNEKAITIVGEDTNTTIIDEGGDNTKHNFTMAVSRSSGFSMSNLTLQNCTSTKGTNFAFFSQNSDNMKIMNCCFRDSINGMQLQYCANTYMRGNRFENNKMNFGLSGWLNPRDFFNDIDTSNTINGKPMYNLVDKSDVILDGIDIGWLGLINCTNITVKNVTISGNLQNILLVNTNYSVIHNCNSYTSYFGQQSIQICFDGSRYNRVENCSSDGVKFHWSRNNTVSDCNFTFGISFELAKYNYINNCTINLTSEKGGVYGFIFIAHSSYNTISNCTIYNTGDSNFKVGCVLGPLATQGPGCHYNKIINNTFSNINKTGIELLYKCTKNKIIGNHIINCCSESNGAGIYISNFDGTSYNTIYNNTFIDNLRDAYSDSKNYWNGSYPTGGNFWDKYNGEDTYRGPGQNISGYDCIIDTSKTVPGNGYNKDRYPLKYLWGENPPVADYTYRLENYTIRLDGIISYDRDGTVESYDWNFGDGTHGNGGKVIHTYSKSGKYKVDLNVTADDGKQGNWSLSFPVPNQVPYLLGDPKPSDGATNVDVNDDLNWNCSGDPDGDRVTYTVYFEADNPTPDVLVSDNQTKKTFDPGKMHYSTHYYWKIVAWDVWGGSTSGPVWDFTTAVPIPDLSCEGILNWVEMEPGATVHGSFTVKNKGDSQSLLDWEIIEWPEWGSDWEFTPMSGEDLKPSDGYLTVIVSVVAPDEKKSDFTGEIKIVNKENSGDNCTIDVSLATPKNKFFFTNFFLLNWFLERFPNVYLMLRHLLELLEYKE